jgi:hypothetical protein
MPFIIPTEQRVSFLIATYSEGGYEAAQITKKDPLYYITELEDIGPMYIMDDYGNTVKVDWDIHAQQCVAYPPLNALT